MNTLRICLSLSFCMIASSNEDGNWLKCKPKPGCSITRCDPKPSRWFENDGELDGYSILCRKDEVSTSDRSNSVTTFDEILEEITKLKGRLERAESDGSQMKFEIKNLERKNLRLKNQIKEMEKRNDESVQKADAALKQVKDLESQMGRENAVENAKNQFNNLESPTEKGKNETRKMIKDALDKFVELEKAHSQFKDQMEKERDENAKTLNIVLDRLRSLEMANFQLKIEMEKEEEENAAERKKALDEIKKLKFQLAEVEKEQKEKMDKALNRIQNLEKRNGDLKNRIDSRKEKESNKNKKILPCDRNPCSVYAVCENLGDSRYKCECYSGYSGNGKVCTTSGFSPCDTNPCDVNALCMTVDYNQYRCECIPGYAGDGKVCRKTATKPCEYKPCHSKAICRNVDDSRYTCNCMSGYAGDGKSCRKI